MNHIILISIEQSVMCYMQVRYSTGTFGHLYTRTVWPQIQLKAEIGDVVHDSQSVPTRIQIRSILLVLGLTRYSVQQAVVDLGVLHR